MIKFPSQCEIAKADKWYRSLSINEMKKYETKHFPSWRQFPTDRMIYQMWEAEGKP